MGWDDHEAGDVLVVQAGLISERLSRVALDVNVALSDTDGLVRARLEQAITRLDQAIRDIRLLAAGQQRLGAGGAGRRRG
ncbi:hypothetical protein [Actinophytocola sp. NPDC049390]|uniref:hypothetical protein n=1 Tax=Actinophytocola sp. NPDC049390 TaxID=3363894 RepID=UPI003787FBD7